MVKISKGKKRANDLDGKTWVRYSISVWSDLQKSSQERALRHPALFPAKLAERIIEMFSRKDELILDPFAGSGSNPHRGRTTGKEGSRPGDFRGVSGAFSKTP